MARLVSPAQELNSILFGRKPFNLRKLLSAARVLRRSYGINVQVPNQQGEMINLAAITDPKTVRTLLKHNQAHDLNALKLIFVYVTIILQQLSSDSILFLVGACRLLKFASEVDQEIEQGMGKMLTQPKPADLESLVLPWPANPQQIGLFVVALGPGKEKLKEDGRSNSL